MASVLTYIVGGAPGKWRLFNRGHNVMTAASAGRLKLGKLK